jgi:hypothetical protein
MDYSIDSVVTTVDRLLKLCLVLENKTKLILVTMLFSSSRHTVCTHRSLFLKKIDISENLK